MHLVGGAGPGDAAVDCMGPVRPVVGWMEMGVLHHTVGIVRRLVHQCPINARVVGVERRCGIVFHPTWLCRDIRSRSGPERAGLKGAGAELQRRMQMLSCI